MKKTKQWAEAARWFRRCAEQGHPGCQTDFAVRLHRGQGVPRDRGQAFQYMLRAARSGDSTAQYNVGVMYGHDVGKARQWLQRSADNGNESARERLKSLSATSTHGAEEAGKVMRAVKRSNVRAGPGTSYAIVGLLKVGEAARVIERSGNWFRLQPTSRQPERFVYGPLLTESGSSKVAQ